MQFDMNEANSVVASTTDSPISAKQRKHFITSLKDLEAELLTVLSLRDDPERLPKAKELIQSYSGSDWLEHRRDPKLSEACPNGYERVCVARHGELFDMLVLSWAPGAKSPIHDHPCERCFLMAISGEMYEQRYTTLPQGGLQKTEFSPIPTGVATWISDDIGLHRVGNGGDTVSFSLHCYIPGFTTPCTIFDETTGVGTAVTFCCAAAK